MSGFLLDTCVVSEPLKPNPNENLLRWWREQDELGLFLSAIVIGELTKGFCMLPHSGKRRALTRTVESLAQRFGTRILPFDTEVARRWGELVADCARRGRPIPAVDGMLAATAISHSLVVVTRNTDDFAPTGVKTLNPFV